MAEKRKKRKQSTSSSEEPMSSQTSEAETAAPSAVSMKSDASMYEPLRFGVEKAQSSRSRGDEPTAPSVVSMKSDASMYEPLRFGYEKTQSSQSRGDEPTAPSAVSMKSDASMYEPLRFGVEKAQSELTGEPSSCSICMEAISDPVRLTCEHWSCKQCVSSDNPVHCAKCGKKLRKAPGHQKDTRGSRLLNAKKNHRKAMQQKFSWTSEEEGRRRLIPAVRTSRKAIFADCKVTEEWVKHLAFGLKFPFSALRDLDLSNNDLKDSGVKLLCDGLSSQCCRLKKLSLSGCQITEEGCDYLAKALKSNPSHLTELDLSYNNLGESGKKLLSELKDDTQYKLDILNVEHDGSQRVKPGFKKYACDLTWDPDTAHKNLLLSEGNKKTGLEIVFAL
ncbi:hypothetical protein PFLUV_G00168900 [Perca fluviatilis]|uniref:RING-type domain-containing protein n=1 Tax=Perca fluviatilis TaxID=8168 RepID=A0A6A5EYZ2_PERFL|nr:hypothetical protein PFLUV_G00168900 [Perca fluviatilis]